jgi:hypothetical protein
MITSIGRVTPGVPASTPRTVAAGQDRSNVRKGRQPPAPWDDTRRHLSDDTIGTSEPTYKLPFRTHHFSWWDVALIRGPTGRLAATVAQALELARDSRMVVIGGAVQGASASALARSLQRRYPDLHVVDLAAPSRRRH